MAVVYRQTWDVLKTGSGISGAANVDMVPWGATARDTDYPNIGLTDTIKVVSNGTRNVLAANTNWLNAGVVWDRGLGAVAGVGNYPTWLNGQGPMVMYADYHITTASLDANTFAPLVGTHIQVGGATLIYISLSKYSPTDWRIDLHAELWNEADINVDSVAVPRGDIENKRVRFKLAWTLGTMDPTGTTVQDDGSLIVSMIDLDTLAETVFYTYTNKSFYFSWAGESLGGGDSVPANNHFAVASVGYAGLIGENEQFVIETATVVPPVPVRTSLAPITPCDPQTPVGNGGKGNAGCNTGGVGFVSSYTGPYGAAIVSADPSNGETLTGKGQVDLWVELVHTDYPTEVVTTYRRSLVELADLSTYRGGRKPAGLISVGEIEHGLANEQGGLEAATVELVFSDALDRFFRTLLSDQDLEGDEIRVCMATPAARAAGTAPRILARAIVQQSPTSSGLEARLTAVDVLFSDFGPFGPDRQWPNIPIPSGVWENTPPESLQLICPVLYGEKSDEGAVNPVTNAANAKGLIPLIYVGQEDLGSDSVDPEPWVEDATITTIPTPLTLTNSTASGGDITVPVYPWLMAVRDGLVSVQPGSVTSTLNPLGVTEPGGIAAVFHFDQVAEADYYIGVVADEYTYHPITNPDVGNIGVGTHDNATFDGWFSNDFSMVVPHLDNAGRVTASNSVWDAYLVHHAAGFQILNLYGSDLGGGVPTNRRDRTLIDTATRGGSDVLGPDWTNWPFADRYRDYTLPDGSSLRLTMIYARGPLSEDHRNGVVNMTVNAIGIEDVGDGTGLPLLDALACEQHWIENYLINGYTSGNWATTGPAYEDGTPKVRSTSFLSGQAFTVAALGGQGLTAGWYVDQAQSVSAWEAEWMRSTETRTGINGHGQVVKFWLDENQDTSTWGRIDHAPDVFGPITRTPGQERENVIAGAACDWDADANKFRVAFDHLKSTTGITKYKNREKPSAPLASTILNVDTHLAWVMQRRLARLQYGEALQDITGPLRWLDTDVGSGILLNSIEGVGASGDVDRRYLILRRKTDLEARLVTYSLLDVEDIIVAAADQFLIGDGATTGPLLTSDGFVVGA